MGGDAIYGSARGGVFYFLRANAPHRSLSALHARASVHTRTQYSTRGVTARQKHGREEPSQDEGDYTLVAFAFPHPRQSNPEGKYMQRYREFHRQWSTAKFDPVCTCRIGIAPRVPERLTKECRKRGVSPQHSRRYYRLSRLVNPALIASPWHRLRMDLSEGGGSESGARTSRSKPDGAQV